MRVILAHKFYELTGGAEVFFRETERVLRQNGHETLMITTGEARSDDPGNLIRMAAPDYDDASLLKKAASLPAAIYDRRKKHKMAEVISTFRPDLLHVFSINVHLSPAIVTAATDAGIPMVGSFNDYKHICPNYKLFHHGRICTDCKGGRFYNAARNGCCKSSRALSAASMIEAYVHKWLGVYAQFSHFTFSSDFMARQTRDFWPDRAISWSKMRNPFDSAAFTPHEGDEAYGLYFGRIIDEKGVDRIIDAAGRIDGFRVKIVGDGPDLEALRARAACEGLTNVTFTGPKWGDDLIPILSRARFVIVPSIWHENFPYVINQAFALARPVIGARRGGIPELIADGERGLVFDPDDRADLAAKITALAQDPELARRMGRKAKQYSDKTFNDTVFLADLMAAYERGGDAHRRHRR